MKKLLLFTGLLLLTGCSTTWLVSTTGHDPIYDTTLKVPTNVQIDTLSFSQLKWKLRTDFQFRYDFAQYALSQPRSFDWNNRVLGNSYNWNRNNWGYSYYNYWNRDQMWNDWVWGFTPHRWSPFGYDRWGYNNWMGNSYYGYGWNNYYGWNNNGWNNWNYYPNYNRRGSVAYINGRRGVAVNTSTRRVRQALTTPETVDQIADRIQLKVKNRRINNTRNDKTINTNPRGYGRPESSNNGRRSRVRENILTQPVGTRQPNSIQPRQVRRGSTTPVLQQTRTSSQPSSQRRSSSSRRKN